MEKNKRKLIAVQLFSALGNSVVGIFLPFLFGRAFDLTTAQIIAGMAGVQLFMMLSVYPLNRLFCHFKTRNIIRWGLVFQAIFLAMLAMVPSTVFWALATILVYILFLVVFHPSWHVALLNSSRDGTRGGFTGNLQIMSVGSGLIAPLLSGLLLDRGWDEGVLAISVAMFLLAIFSLNNVDLPRQKLSKFIDQWKVFRDYLWKTPHRLGVISDGVQSGTLWIMWPIFLGAALGSFTQMGIVVALAALAEVLVAKFFGKFTDRKTARKALDLGQWFRGLDIGIRSLLMFFPSLFMAGVVTVGAGILGPIFNISLYSRTCEIAEKASPRELEWFIAREWVLGAIRFVWMSLGAIAVYLWGDMVIGWILIVAALTSFGFRRY